MKKVFILSLIVFSVQGFAQLKPAKNYSSFELGNGLNFGFNDSTYLFKISGMVQPYIAFDKMTNQDALYYFNSKRSYLNFSGVAVKEKVEFFLQLDYSLPGALLDAYITYHPIKNLSISMGQKQNIANNREMLIMEDRLQYPDRSMLSQEYSRSGREFGFFLDYKAGNSTFAIVPQVSVTSGDGRNSFGVDSRDSDLGGFKYSGRLDVYPFGFFSAGNDKSIADLQHEQTIKMVLGGAASFNDGASQAVGEGHGDFVLYNANGKAQQPDYRQVYGDIVVKYQGFSLLGEYGVATATNLEGTYITPSGTDALLPTEISEFLALGTGYNVQLGYVSKIGYALDLRYAGIAPEFSENAASVIQQKDGYTIGLSKYFKGNALKIQAAFSQFTYADGSDMMLGQLLFQVIF